MKPCIFILLPVYNRRDITETIIDVIESQTWDNFHLILIDDGSTDGTAEMVSRHIEPAKLTTITGHGNWWWAGSLEKGIKWLLENPPKPRDIILILNDDVVFDKYFLSKAVEFMAPSKHTLLLAQFYEESNNKTFETGIHADFNDFKFYNAKNSEEINCLSTRGLFLHWIDLKNIGNFHAKLLPHYWSDYEFTIRANRLGMKLTTKPEISLSPNNKSTGIHSLDPTNFDSLYKFTLALFSKRSVPNPYYRCMFILLASPKHMIPKNIAKTWLRTMSLLKKMLIRTIKLKRSKHRLRKRIRASAEPLKVILGAGSTRIDGWIPTDYPIVDISDHASIGSFFNEGSISMMLSEHVWEHLTNEQAQSAARNCLSFLKPGGHLRVAVPDGNHPDKDYIEQVRPGGYGPGSDDHKALYTASTFSKLFAEAGFNVELLEWFDVEGQFHAVDWSPEDGMVNRSTRFDPRNAHSKTTYTSLILDARKPEVA